MAIFRCKMCGGDLEIHEGNSAVTCEFCGTQQTIPTIKDENLQVLFNRANVLRMKSEFDKAEEIYEKILQANEKEAEAYWGLILCKYGIEYVEDPATYKRIPTCHRTSFDAITADEDYKSALKYADVVQKNIYETEAKAIDEIQKGILSISQQEDPYKDSKAQTEKCKERIGKLTEEKRAEYRHNAELESTYRKALSIYQSYYYSLKNYKRAKIEFEKIIDYKDSREYIKKIDCEISRAAKKKIIIWGCVVMFCILMILITVRYG